MKTLVPKYSPFVWISFSLSIIQIVFCSNDTCYGPRTRTQLAYSLWGSGNYTDIITRPSISKLIAQNPLANPNLAGPDIISTGMAIVSVKSLDQKRGEVELQVWYNLNWNDYRLAYESLGNCYPQDHLEVFLENYTSNIWMPYIKIYNSVSPPIQSAASIYISPNGTVSLWQDLVMKLSCPLVFDEFPKDTQICKIITGAWADKDSNIQLKLRDDPIAKVESSDYNTADTIEWVTSNYNADTKVDDYGYTMAIFSFSLTRNSNYYMQFVVFPVVTIVFLSWTSFFIDRGAVPARVTMSIVCFLAMTNFMSSQLKLLPMIGSNDGWLLQFLLVSQVFTFAATVEYVICNYLYRVRKRLRNVEKLAKEEKVYQMALKNDSVDIGGNSEREDSMRDSLASIVVDKADLLAIGGVHKIDRLLLKKDGTMIIADENVEVFARYVYPIAYFVSMIVILMVKFS